MMLGCAERHHASGVGSLAAALQRGAYAHAPPVVLHSTAPKRVGMPRGLAAIGSNAGHARSCGQMSDHATAPRRPRSDSNRVR